MPKPQRFRFHLMGETYTLDPIKIRGSSGSYLFHNLYRGLYRYHRERGLITEGAKSCLWITSVRLECELQKRFWSNGEPILPRHYIQSFRRLIGPESKSSNQEHLRWLKNADAILLGAKPPESLGVSQKSKNKKDFLIFEFKQSDPEFLYKLALPAMSPIYNDVFPKRSKADQLVVSGPFKIKIWNKGHSIILTPNPKYPTTTKSKVPEVEVLFIDDDSTALRMFEAGKLDLLRRLPSQYIGKFKKRSDFFQFPMARFDYIGFGPRFKSNPKLRKAFSLGVNYEELKSILHALGKPGCPALPAKYLKNIPCHKFQPGKAKAIIKDLIKNNQLPENIVFQYSRMGGEDIKRQAEWFQYQWKKHLGITITIEPIEQGMLTKKILTNPGDLFRKGNSLDRPTCLAAAESLTPNHPENYLQLNDPQYNQKLKSYVTKVSSKTNSPADCSLLMNHLVEKHHFIPMGEIHFSMLAGNQFTGWHINELNQLDLTDLRISK